MANGFWLFKSEPDTFSIDDLENSPHQTSAWDGVRNYQARNFLRDEVAAGDQVLFYHSNAKPSGIAGMCEVVKSGYPDITAFNPESPFYVPGSTPDNPVWYMVDVRFVSKLARVIPLAVLKQTAGLELMMLTQKGSRLSIQPVTPVEWRIIAGLMKQYR